MLSSRLALLGSSSLSFTRTFASSSIHLSNIGKVPVRLSEGVECYTEDLPKEFARKFRKGKDIHYLDRLIVVKGPKGELKAEVPSFVNLQNENNHVTVTVANPQDKLQRSMWGTARSIVQNNMIGLTEGHLAFVKFVGTGYRAVLEKDAKGKDVIALKVGQKFTPRLPVPSYLTVSLPNPARLLIEGADKQKVFEFAAAIRAYKKPEPYKGKGIFINNETIRMKEKKLK
ncbi:uncharacterized protein KQ657_004640 [Scheffersomyces spartinae]|uniref:Large ribosomal subunit protein uL6 alpha-beta domain-containing protein n=1 Tax=Scheffersomyces spartinae TaxID=45513 RepID=A0A9P7VAP0_9ASCO|nr:uncharacterized protein KQ657_004640 [Scheffersomyces spartinae]KAG7194427.1 hypothetical protein KQ657_004640 [Scheffersomyces spartinae]